METIEFAIWLKIIGTFLSGFGSLLLAWRVKVLLKWITYSITAHETSIKQLIRVLNNEEQTEPTITGTPIHLLHIEDKLGFYLLISGFISLGLGMFLNGISYLV